MTSWQGSTPPQVQADMDRVFDAALSLARELTSTHGTFIPVSIQLDGHGQQRVVTADPGSGDDGRAAHDLIYRGMRSQGQALRCVAVAADVRIGGSDPTDAFRIHVEHHDGPSVVVYIPYTAKRRLRRREISLGDAQVGPEPRHVW